MKRTLKRANRLGLVLLLHCVISSAAFAQPGPSVSLTKTVGTDPLTCGNETTIQVAAGTTVYYCYTILNDGGVNLTSYDLHDSELGVLLDDFAFVLTPAASFDSVTAGLIAPAVIDTTTANTGTVIADVEGGGTVQDSAQATVEVGTAPGPAVPIPTLSALGLMVLAGAMLLIAARRRVG